MFKLEKRDQQLLYSHFQVNKYFSWYFIVLWSSMKYSTKVEGAFASTSIWTSFHVCKHTSKEKKACVTDNSRKKQKNRKEMEKQNRKRKKTFRKCTPILTLQLFSSSAFTIMVPHFFPWMPLYTWHKTKG